MAISSAGSRNIIVDEFNYKWLVRRKGTYSQSNAWTGLSFAAELTDGGGSTLHATLSGPRSDNYLGVPSGVVTPGLVAKAIRGAMAAGWEPTKRGPSFQMQFDCSDGDDTSLVPLG